MQSASTQARHTRLIKTCFCYLSFWAVLLRAPCVLLLLLLRSNSSCTMWRGVVTLFSMGKSISNTLLRGWDGDGREKALLEYVQTHAEQGNPDSVIQAIDDFAAAGTWFMNIGYDKGKILDAALIKKNPQAVLELGTYCGYSAVRIASQLKEPDSKLISLEISPGIAEIARKIIDHAGLSSKVQVLLAPLSNQIDELKSILKSMNKGCFDFIFIDHHKNSYLPDYLLLKENNFLDEGTVVFADNMGFPGSPKFWKYLETHPQELETEYHKSKVEYMSWIPDTVTISTFHRVSSSSA